MVVELTAIEERWAQDGVESERRLELNDAIHRLKALYIRGRRRFRGLLHGD